MNTTLRSAFLAKAILIALHSTCFARSEADSDASASEASTRPPQVVERGELKHPAHLRDQRIIGRADVRCVIDENGQARDIKVIFASLPAFGTAAVEAVRGSRFRPGFRAGQAVAQEVELPVKFEFSQQQRDEFEARRVKEVLPAGPQVFDAPEVDRLPELIKEIRPKVPVIVREKRTTGNALIGMVVDEKGQVRDLHLIEATLPGCGEAAMEAARQWRFVPGQKNGAVVRVSLEATIAFFPEDRRASGCRVKPGVSRNLVTHFKENPVVQNEATRSNWVLPKRLKAVAPEFPEEMRARMKAGVAEVELIINPAGIVTHIRTRSATNDFFAIAAERAVSNWTCDPATKDGVPVFCHVLQVVQFGYKR